MFKRKATPFTNVLGSGEVKFFDLAVNDAVVATTGTITDSVCQIAQGITDDDRVGRQCTVKSIQWRYRVTLPEISVAASPAAGDTVRVVLFLDKQCNGATAAVLDLFENTSYQAFGNLAEQRRFHTLYDRIHSLNYMGMANNGGALVHQAFVIRDYEITLPCDIVLEFDSTTGDITEITSNNIGVYLNSASGVAGFTSRMRLRFTDP